MRSMKALIAAAALPMLLISPAEAKHFMVTVSPLALNFGKVTVGATSPGQNVTVTNSGSGSVLLTAFSYSVGFTNTGSGTCIAGNSYGPGSHCTISVAFKPALVGTVSGVLKIYDNAANSPQSVSLSGTGCK